MRFWWWSASSCSKSKFSLSLSVLALKSIAHKLEMSWGEIELFQTIMNKISQKKKWGMHMHWFFCKQTADNGIFHNCELDFNSYHLLVISDGSNNVPSSIFDCSKPKIGCSSSITKRWTSLSPFHVQKNKVGAYLLNIFAKLVKALLGSIFGVRLFETKNRVFMFNYQ